jgi:hypothetical protein
VTDRDTAKPERQGLVSGKWLLLATLSLIVIVPALTYLTFELASRDVGEAEQPLQWDNRRQWSAMGTTPVTFRRGMMSSARTGKTFEDFGFYLDAETKKTLQQCAELARQPSQQFASTKIKQQLQDHRDKQPALFYPHYLLGAWHRLNGNPDKADSHYRAAFKRAGAAVIRPYKTAGNTPAADHSVGTLAIAIDQVINDRLVQDVQLIYPRLRTDDQGQVYLPVFADTPYRFADPNRPAATQPGTAKGWFTFPGRVGRVEPVAIKTPSPSVP